MPGPRDWTAQLIEGDTIVGDLDGSPDLATTWHLDDADSATFSLPPGNPVKARIRPLITDLRVNYKGEPLFRGRITGRNRSIDDTTSSASFVAVGYRGILGRRIRSTTWASSTTPADGAWAIIDAMQSRSGPGWDLGITRGDWLPFGPTRNLTAEPNEGILAIVDRFAGQHPGFDWWIDGRRRFQASPWRGETERAWLLRWGETVTELAEDWDSANYANHINASGADGVPRYQKGAADQPLDLPRPEGRWQHLHADSDLKTAAEVQAAGDQALDRMSTLAPGYKAKVIRGAWTPEDAWIGDVIRIQSRHPELTVDTADRISSLTVSLDPDGHHPDVDIACGTSFVEDLAVMLGRVPRRLVDLDRR